MSPEAKVSKLEKTVAQQGYVIVLLLCVVPVDTAGMLWLWQERGRPDYDHIAVALTVFQTLFGVAALYGFWALRGLTKERAEEVAETVALSETRRLIPSIVAREMRENYEAFRPNDPISDQETKAMVKAIGDNQEGKRGQSNADRSSSPDEHSGKLDGYFSRAWNRILGARS